MKLLLYCTKRKPYLVKSYKGLCLTSYYHRVDVKKLYDAYFILSEKYNKDVLNGKIVAECDFEVEEIKPSNLVDFEIESCVNRVSMLKYFKPNLIWDNKFETLLNTFGNSTLGYAIHIKNLHIFDEPKELSEFYVKKAPQNMMRVDYINIENAIFLPYILISIRPEWLCKILNGEKTIEVRKKVLKGMI